MRFLYLIHRSWPYHGGSERYVWEHALETVRRGHDAFVATTVAWDMSVFTSGRGRRLPAGCFSHRGITVRRFPVKNPPMQHLFRALFRRLLPGGPDRFFYPNPFVPSMDRWLKLQDGFDIVHANAMPFLIYGGYRYSVKRNVPLVSVPHANLGGPGNRIEPLRYFAGSQPDALRSSALVIAQNRYEASVYRDEAGVPDGSIFIQGSGVDPDEWQEVTAERCLSELGIPRNEDLILSVTAHCRDKGSFALLDAAVSLWSSGRNFTLVMAGPVLEDFRRHLDRRSASVPDGKLIVTGYVSEDLRKSLFKAASVIAAPSRLDAFGIVVLDGWVAGKPVIGCSDGGMADLIRNGKDGFLVGFDDSRDLADKAALLLEDRCLAGEMGRSGRERVLSGYTWRHSTGRFFAELERRGLC